MKYDEKNNCIENWELLPTTHTLIAHKIGMNHLLKNILKVIYVTTDLSVFTSNQKSLVGFLVNLTSKGSKEGLS